jgi:putative ABC transport system permease protein
MRAFGLPVRTVLGVVIKESAIVGIIATVLGLIGGVAFLQWMLTSLATTTHQRSTTVTRKPALTRGATL